MHATDDGSRFGPSLLSLLLAAGLAVATTSCEEAFSGPSIDSATISPSEIPASDTGMGDECFTVEMSVSGFEADLEEVTIFIVEDDNQRVTATPGTFDQCKTDTAPTFTEDGSRITVEGIPKTRLVSGLDPGEYGIGATIVDVEGGEVTQRGITTLRIVESN